MVQPIQALEEGLAVRDLVHCAILANVNVQSTSKSAIAKQSASIQSLPVRLVVHCRHIALLQYTVLLRKVLLRECDLIAAFADLLAHELVHPVGCLIAILRLKTWYYERHVVVL